jgi:hypothetical protein
VKPINEDEAEILIEEHLREHLLDLEGEIKAGPQELLVLMTNTEPMEGQP